MDEYSILMADDLRKQCKLTIKNLNKDNESLDIVNKKINEFINNSITSVSIDGFKKYLENYSSVIKALKTANDLDIYDAKVLMSEIGDKNFVGSQILEQKRFYDEQMREDEERMEDYESKAKNTYFFWMEAYYHFKAEEYKTSYRFD